MPSSIGHYRLGRKFGQATSAKYFSRTSERLDYYYKDKNNNKILMKTIAIDVVKSAFSTYPKNSLEMDSAVKAITDCIIQSKLVPDKAKKPLLRMIHDEITEPFSYMRSKL